MTATQPTELFRLQQIFALLTLLLSASCVALDEVQVSEFRFIDHQYLEQARQRLNDRSQRRVGTAFRGNRQHDLPLLQRLLDEKHVRADELELLQAMGVILGDVLGSEYPMQWIRYRDSEGVSRALQLRHHPHIVFPLTAISRRASVGAPVDVEALYHKLRDPIAEAYQR